MKKIGERIKIIRKELKLTQEEFGLQIGVKGNTVTGYERGTRSPSDAIINMICLIFNVDQTWLRTGEGDNPFLCEPDFMNALDAKDLVADVLNTGIAEDINVYIGDELEDEKLKNFSIVTFNHLLGDKDIGTIGIIGPKRMDYAKVISVMKYISKKLKDDFNDK